MDKTRSKSIKGKKEEQGYILVIGIVFMTCLLLLVLPFLLQLSTEYRLTNKYFQTSSALSLAEAGIERAIWEINKGNISDWNGDSSLRTLTISKFQAADGNIIGDIEIRIANPGGENPIIESTGSITGSDSIIYVKIARVVLERGASPLFDYGVFGNEGVDIDSNAVIDSYDSRLGGYGGTNVGSEGNVGTNGTFYGCIALSSNAKVFGNAVVGPGSDPEIDIITRSNSKIYGEKLSLSEEKAMPSISPPGGLPYMGSYYLEGKNIGIINQSGEYASFRLTSNSKVMITADVTLYITGEFSMSSNSQLEIVNDAKVTIYLGGSFIQESNTEINNLSKKTNKLILVGTEGFNGFMVWNSNSQFYGAVYVPNATVDFKSNSNFYGSVVGKKINSISSNAKIHFDKALAELSVDGANEDSPYVVKSWQEKMVRQ